MRRGTCSTGIKLQSCTGNLAIRFGGKTLHSHASAKFASSGGQRKETGQMPECRSKIQTGGSEVKLIKRKKKKREGGVQGVKF